MGSSRLTLEVLRLSHNWSQSTMNIKVCLLTLCVTILPQLSTQAPVPTTVVVDLLPLAIGGTLLLKGLFVGNSLAHVANEDRNGGFKRKRKVSPTPRVVLGGPLVSVNKPRYGYPTPFRYISDGV